MTCLWELGLMSHSVFALNLRFSGSSVLHPVNNEPARHTLRGSSVYLGVRIPHELCSQSSVNSSLNLPELPAQHFTFGGLFHMCTCMYILQSTPVFCTMKCRQCRVQLIIQTRPQ